MNAHEATLRQKKILENVRKNKQVRVNDLASQFDVSKVTIRSDLDYLATQGLVQRTHGGAMLGGAMRRESPLEITSRENEAVKRRIGAFAASLVKDGDTIIIDVGSTTTELARALSASLQDVVVITNALNIALLLEDHPGVTVIVTGGTLRALQHSLVDPFASRLFEDINVDKAFLGCNGVDAERGFSNANLHEAEVKRAMVRAASRVSFLADHSKLGVRSTARIADVTVAERLITDSAASEEALSALQTVGLHIDIV